ncbi:MAG: VOC family protein [Candidatus Hydrogenedentota bacterium]
MITRLFETHVPVSDLTRSMRFYEGVVGLELGTVDEARRIAFYFIGGWNKSMLGLWEKPAGEVQPQHLAFEVPINELTASIAELRSHGIETRDFFGRATEVPTVFCWMPAVSIYFSDPDGHSLEYIAPLPGPPRPEAGVVPWPEWIARY